MRRGRIEVVEEDFPADEGFKGEGGEHVETKTAKR